MQCALRAKTTVTELSREGSIGFRLVEDPSIIDFLSGEFTVYPPLPFRYVVGPVFEVLFHQGGTDSLDSTYYMYYTGLGYGSLGRSLWPCYARSDVAPVGNTSPNLTPFDSFPGRVGLGSP